MGRQLHISMTASYPSLENTKRITLGGRWVRVVIIPYIKEETGLKKKDLLDHKISQGQNQN